MAQSVGEPGPDPEALWPPRPRSRRDHHARRERRRQEQQERREQRGRQRPRGRARQTLPLSRDQIVRTAVGVADAEGPDAVNMRRIARELGVGTMSLYWHVDNKDELLLLMLDAIMGEIEMPDPPSGDWWADLATIAHNSRAVLRRHPWLASLIGGHPPVGPNFLRHFDRTLAVLDGLGLPSRSAIEIVMAVDTYVNGFVLRELQEKTVHQRERRFDGEVRQAWRSYMKEALAAGVYPHIAQMAADGVDPDAEGTVDERFAFGLECLLDGIAARLPQLSRRS